MLHFTTIILKIVIPFFLNENMYYIFFRSTLWSNALLSQSHSVTDLANYLWTSNFLLWKCVQWSFKIFHNYASLKWSLIALLYSSALPPSLSLPARLQHPWRSSGQPDHFPWTAQSRGSLCRLTFESQCWFLSSLQDSHQITTLKIRQSGSCAVLQWWLIISDIR